MSKMAIPTRPMKGRNAFEQYLRWLNDGSLGGNLIQIGYRAHTRARKDIPEGIKGILAGTSDSDSGVLFLAFKLINRIEGSIELAYRRGYQAGLQDGSKSSPKPQDKNDK